MALVVKDMWEDPVCDNHQFQINMKIMTSAHNRCTMPWLPWAEATIISLIEQTKRTKSPSCTLSIWRWKKQKTKKPKTHCADIDFSGAGAVTCFHTVTMLQRPARPLVFWQGGALTLRGATELPVTGTDLICSVTTERQQGRGETWSALWRSALSPRNRMGCWLPVHTLHRSPYLLRQILLFTQRSTVSHGTRSPQLAGITSNITISCKLGLKSWTNHNLISNPAHR